MIAGLIGGVVVLAWSAGVAAPAGTPSHAVSIVDYSFSPGALTVRAGETVVWTNNGTVEHTVTADDGSMDSGSIAPGDTFSHTFSSAGSVPYYCAFHGVPGGEGMAGRITVEAVVATTTTMTAGPGATSPATAPGATTEGPGATPTVAPAELARTGSSNGALTLVAVALVGVGLLALAGERRRT